MNLFKHADAFFACLYPYSKDYIIELQNLVVCVNNTSEQGEIFLRHLYMNKYITEDKKIPTEVTFLRRKNYTFATRTWWTTLYPTYYDLYWFIARLLNYPYLFGRMFSVLQELGENVKSRIKIGQTVVDDPLQRILKTKLEPFSVSNTEEIYAFRKLILVTDSFRFLSDVMEKYIEIRIEFLRIWQQEFANE